ncbi:PstS family phosphate ABC transporter substrate-binding protein [Leadbetterella sp. DM7]|uniref:PstS family phosphate ABC transporter substrate-binding protein n=1 Tax=Leadbetterella sp. DM7 TaxID=3235085 RepID=UPI00349EE266
MMRWIGIMVCVLVLAACQSKKSDRPSIYEGRINVGMDESIGAIIHAETDGYRMHYPRASFDNYVMPENTAVKLLLEDSMDVICITRTLNEEEMKVLEKREITYKPAPMALDAVVLVMNREAQRTGISLAELRQLFTSGDSPVKLVFDSGNSSNLNQVLGRLGITDFSRKNVVAAGGNQKVFDWVQKDRNAIGFVGYNLISEKSSEVTRELKNSVKILNVSGDGAGVLPSKTTILDQTYPFHRTIYLHTLGTAWGVENGFIRFACSKPGQLIAEKMGLVPYYAIPKEFVLSKESLD